MVDPVAGVARIAVKHEHGGVRAVALLGPQQFGMDACAARAGEVHVIAVRERRLKVGRNQFNLGIQRPHLGEAAIPERVEVARARVDALIFTQLLHGHVKQ